MKQVNIGDCILSGREWVESNSADYDAYGGGYYKRYRKKVSNFTIYVKEE